MFYICHYKATLSEAFLDYLWKKFSNPNTCPITRQLCAYYIGSYISRAQYLNINLILASLQLMVKWLHNYMDTIDSCKLYPNLDIHRTFYSLCQTVFYIIVFRHFDLFTSTECIDKIKSWKLASIIGSKLNPLRFCLPIITQKFAAITRMYQIAYCYTIIDANNRLTLPILNSGLLKKKFFAGVNNSFNENASASLASTDNVYDENPLDSFFPFDPYLLKRSKPYIESFIQPFKDFAHDSHDADSEMDVDEDGSVESSCDEDDSDKDDDEDDEIETLQTTRSKDTRNPWSDEDD
jgi:RNA polymerase I-specific transcription initiation factor RRN3